MRKQSVNFWAVLVCVVLGQVIPALWYTIFSDQWMALNGFTVAQLNAGTTPFQYLASIVSSALMALTLAWVFIKIPVKSLASGLTIGLLFGFVFVFLEIVVKDMFSMRPLMLSFIDGGVSVIVYAITGSILGAWRKYD
ncbi:DUF1761 domain-containing protein [Dyadobacter sp. CY326]|uniref:DUF1761 domain-containing protein n=1 Tax=Dyadobacter sp. CY326 TaxID=2907300 RepID=UPI001F19D36F|nr:DUF1761 domain-containing protein [Dyadobacter sp. CY326]MCE7066909.1 DUF1761 domain-containing protein [Dyadobacter sp. CY326]